MFEFRGREFKIIIAVLVLSGSFLFFGNVKNAAAFLNSYSKPYNGTLAASEWNNLALDFLNKSGGATMTGPLGIGTSTPASGLWVNGPIYATNFSGGSYTGFIDAANVMGGSGSSFGSNSGGGNYSFPANLGIGTTNPSTRLHVQGASGITSFTGATWLGAVFTGAISTNDYSGLDITVIGGLPRARIASVATGAGSYLSFGTSNSYGSGITNQALTIDYNGNVGIGTTNPNDLLSIGAAPAGSAGTGHNYTMTYLSNDGYALVNYGTVQTLIGNATSSLVAGNLWNGTLNGNIYNGTAGAGNVGIGTTGPVTRLDVLSSTSNSAIKTGGLEFSSYAVNNSWIGENTYFNGGAHVYRANGYASQIYFETGGGISFYTAPSGLAGNSIGATARLSILNGGNVGIGTTNPGYKLDVNGIVRINDSTPYVLGNVSGVQRIQTGPGNFQFANSSNGYADIYAGNGILTGVLTASGAGASSFVGNVGIGTTAPNDTFSIGNAGAAPAGSAKTGHNYTMTYLSNDGYALVNYGTVQTLIGNATSSLVAGNLWNGTLNGNIYNGTAGAGNVGIGTTGPNGKLNIKTTSANPVAQTYTGAFVLDSSDGRTSLQMGIGNTTWDGTWIQSFNEPATAANYYTLALNPLGGNVGIGTTGPTRKLQVAGDMRVDGMLDFNGISDSKYLKMTTDGLLQWKTHELASGHGFEILNSASSPIVHLDINGNSYLNGGNVGIATTTPAYKLEVNGTLKASANSSSLILDSSGNVSIGL